MSRRDGSFYVRTAYGSSAALLEPAAGDHDPTRLDARGPDRPGSATDRGAGPGQRRARSAPRASCSDDGWRSLLAAPMLRGDQLVGVLGHPPSDDRVRSRPTWSSCCESARQPVGAGHPQRAPVRRAGDEDPRAGGRQPAQVRVPGQHVPRAADSAQRGHRLLRGTARPDVRRASTSGRRSTSTTSGTPAGTSSSCSTRSWTCRRSRPGQMVLEPTHVLGAGSALEYGSVTGPRARRRARHHPDPRRR